MLSVDKLPVTRVQSHVQSRVQSPVIKKPSQKRSLTSHSSFRNQQPELSFLQLDLSRAAKYGRTAVDVFQVPSAFVSEPPIQYSELLLAANSKRKKANYKPIWVPHKHDIARGLFPEYHVVKGSGDTFFSAVARAHRSAARARVAMSLPETTISSHDASKAFNLSATRQKADAEQKRASLEAQKKKKKLSMLGGLQMNILAERSAAGLYEVGSKEEDHTLSGSEDDLDEDKVTDFTQLIEILHSKGVASSAIPQYSAEEDRSERVLNKYGGVRTMHLQQHTGRQKQSQTDESRSNAKSISMSYLKGNLQFNRRMMSEQSLRTEKLRNKPRRQRIRTIEHRLKQHRESSEITTYYDGREWLQNKEKEEVELQDSDTD